VELRQRLLLSALLGLAAVLHAAEPAPGGAAFAQLANLSAQGAQVSAEVWDLDSGRALASLNPDTRLTPASLSKIVIAAAALQTWAPDKTFATEVRATAPLRAGLVQGDLILRGSGDATLDETTLWGLASQLRGAGVRRISGKLLVERTPFGELECDTIDRCGALRRSGRAYNAAPSAIGVNYGSWCVSIRATVPGQPARVGGCATGELPIPLDGKVLTVVANGAARVDRATDSGDRLSVSGTISQGETRQVHRAMSDPAAGAGLILRSILMQIGIVLDGAVETVAQAVPSADQVLARVDGLPLQEQVGRMMRWSNNYVADVLTMGVALERNRKPPRSLAEAANELVALVRGSSTNPSSGESNGPVMHSGSGLTTTNRLSAVDFIGVLRSQYQDSRHFPAFYGSFVVPRDASFSYLRSGTADWLDRVALKTGSLTEPVSVNGIAGYLRKKNGGWMAFAIIVNGSERLRQISHERALGAARADLQALLAHY
jgi:D-alanyl-D-alanine carboxypeptidase/D-alanyl-D-alanine-endopeptidase (penicillin-binding protein 4)